MVSWYKMKPSIVPVDVACFAGFILTHLTKGAATKFISHGTGRIQQHSNVIDIALLVICQQPIF